MCTRFLFLACLLAVTPVLAATCPVPRTMTFHVTGEIHRDVPGFTEGLEAHDGVLYESTGDVVGESRINRIAADGKVTAMVNAHRSYFGEGLTFLGGRVFQMSWREHRVFVYDETFHKLGELRNPREGWGLTNDGAHLIASDGSERLFFVSPKDFSLLGALTVMDGIMTVPAINELEYVKGAIYANVFETSDVLRISAASGCVEARADLRGLYDRLTPADRSRVDADGNFVLNGIAYDGASGLFTVTGKYWPVLFTGRFEDAPAARP